MPHVFRPWRYAIAPLSISMALVVSWLWFAGSLKAVCIALVVAVVPVVWRAGRGPGFLSAILVFLGAWISRANAESPLQKFAVIAISGAFAGGLVVAIHYWRTRPTRPAPLWNHDQGFKGIISQIPLTLVDRTRLYMLYQLAKYASRLPGDVAEVGVYRGGTARLLARALSPKTVHLFDTFAGMPPVDDSVDSHRQGDFSDTSLAAVQRNLAGCKNVCFYKGLFPDTAAPTESRKFCFVHVDVDIYTSVRDCCSFFYPKLEKDGVIVFDDYGFPSCMGARKAVDEFFAAKPEVPIYLPTGQCVVIRS